MIAINKERQRIEFSSVTATLKTESYDACTDTRRYICLQAAGKLSNSQVM